MDAEETLMKIWNILANGNNLPSIRKEVNQILIQYFENQIQANLDLIRSKLGV